MNIQTRLFGEIEVDGKKIINFKDGMIGYEDLKQFMIIHDSESKSNNVIWLQSLDETSVAFPVIDPLFIKADYNPTVEDELFKNIGEIEEGSEEELVVLTTLTAPSDVTKLSTNLRAPIIINPHTLKGCQIIVDNDDYPVKYYIYDILKANKDNKADNS